MRSLFGKIFIWFCATVVLGLVSTISAGYFFNLPGPGDRRGPIPELLRITGRDMLVAFETGGPAKLRTYLQSLEKGADLVSRLYDDQGNELSGLGGSKAFSAAVAQHLLEVPLPTPGARSTSEHWGPRFQAEDGTFRMPPPPKGPPPGVMRHGHFMDTAWVFSDDGTPYIRLLKFPSPLHLLRLFRDKAFTSRLLIFLGAGFLFCYLLARHLSRPVRTLQTATRRLRAGDLSVRVGREKGLHYSEIRNLARDFDSMAERLEKLVRTQQRLICDISHELRSPLTRLNLSLELARQRSGPKARNALDCIETDSARLEELIDQALAFARMDNLPEESLEETVNLGALLVAVARDADLEAQAKNVTLKVDVQSTAVLSASQELLRRTLENVIRNAIRHTPENSSVDILMTREEGGREILVRVRDYGPGAPEEHLSDLFRPFFRADASRDRGTGGTGLGLAIASRAVRLHGGSITAANATDGGLVVDIRLPLDD
ncbi:ATP-binding protein [Desulfocurvus sp. DL9XJH121]